MVQHLSPLRAVGSDGAMGDTLFGQAEDAGRSLLTAMIAQTRVAGHGPINYAVSVIWERSGTVSAWLATSEGASYIPMKVRVPEDVRLAITDPTIGRELWEATAAAGVSNPLEVLVRQAQIREANSPGSQVLAIASNLPADRVGDWASQVGARAVAINASTVAPNSMVDASMLHRCAVAMPWEWAQANAFSEEDRERIAARHMRMATLSGHHIGHAGETVMGLFEEGKPISEDLWAKVREERYAALTQYQLATSVAGQGGSDPAGTFKAARAAEVVECLRDCRTVEGCADLLYATRLAGAPLAPGAAAA